jgi:2-oxoglutarate ferredoxin oxidoreductase subunit alpha
MNQHLCAPFDWDDSRQFDRGKVMTAEELEAGKEFGRYLDVDGDGIAYRTYPGSHPSRGSFFNRGTSRDRYARYTEEGGPYVDNMQRLLRKFDTAKRLVPKPVIVASAQPTRLGAIYLGSSNAAVDEAVRRLEWDRIPVDRLRVRGFPFSAEVADFIADHEHVFVVEQNRDGQLRTLLLNECGSDPAKLIPALHYDGTPITARFIQSVVRAQVAALTAAKPSKAS